jgi:hypothetical protein
MAFCNSCGGAMDMGAKFCPKCGTPAPAAVIASAPPPVTPAAASGPGPGSSALKIILIVVAVLFAIGILGAGTLGFIAWRFAHHTHVVNRNGEVRVETPFGTAESTQDPIEAARNVGVDLYPGATVAKGSAANLTIGSMHTAAVDLDTSDPPSTVNDFYKSKLPGANVMSSQGDTYTIMSGDKNNMTTVNIEPRDGKTRIHIARITGKLAGIGSNN